MDKIKNYIKEVKENYSSPKEFFSEPKNIVVFIAGWLIVGVIAVGVGKIFPESPKGPQDVAIEEEDKINKENEKKYETERIKVLNAKGRLEKDIADGKDIKKGITLTDEEIEKYKITEEEIKKFNDTVKSSIESVYDNYTERQYKAEIKRLLSEYSAGYPDMVYLPDYEYNEDKTICTATGNYTSSNEYGADVRGEYNIKFDHTTGKVIESFIGNEKVTKKKN